MRRDDLLHQLASARDASRTRCRRIHDAASRAVCVTARVAFGAGAVSVAALREESLRYVAAAGEGADHIVGTELPVNRGITGSRPAQRSITLRRPGH